MDLRWLSFILLGASCLAFGYLLGTRCPSLFHLRTRSNPPTTDGPEASRKKGKKGKPPLEIEKLADILDDFKMVLVVRNDLKMEGRLPPNAVFFYDEMDGVFICTSNHATLGLYKKLLKGAPKASERWEMCAQPKVVLKIETEDDMLALQEKAKGLKLPTHITIDAGRTQIASNSRTVMAILGPVELVDYVTGELKLM